MDELNIQSNFLKSIISKIITKILKKKFDDFDVVLNLNNLSVKVDDTKIYISADVNATANKEIIPYFIKNLL